jgi:hypothetical protein
VATGIHSGALAPTGALRTASRAALRHLVLGGEFRFLTFQVSADPARQLAASTAAARTGGPAPNDTWAAQEPLPSVAAGGARWSRGQHPLPYLATLRTTLSPRGPIVYPSAADGAVLPLDLSYLATSRKI